MMPPIDVAHICYAVRSHFFSAPKMVLHDVCFAVHQGEVLGFLGPNGAGKTTLIKILLNLLRPQIGQVHLNGSLCSAPRARASVGFLPERAYYPGYLTAYEFVLSHGLLAGLSLGQARRRTHVVLEQTGIGPSAKKRLHTFSKGMLQRCGLAQALVADPAVLILDEPMSGLDPLGRRDVQRIMQQLRDAQKTVLFSSHILPDVARVCDRVAILVDGQIRRIGTVPSLVAGLAQSIEVTFGAIEPAHLPPLVALCQKHHALPDGHSFACADLSWANRLIDAARARHIAVTGLQTGIEGIEQLFASEAPR